MNESLIYHYDTASKVSRSAGSEELFLARYSEVEKREAPVYFQGTLLQPFVTARCLLTLSKVVQSSFSMSPFDMSLFKDPVVTAGNEKLRFEGFSHCAGVYARLDIRPGAHSGEFPVAGTTNVDFNQPMLSALSSIVKGQEVSLSIGRKDVTLQAGENKVTERKVPLPVKWIKGFASVQVFLSEAEKAHQFNRVQTLQLFQSIPRGVVKADHYLVVRGGKPVFSPVAASNAVCVGGIHRLRLLEPLLPLADELRIYAHPAMQSTTWQLYFGGLTFTLSLSREAWRGFSGEGAVLDALMADVPDAWIEAVDNYGYTNQTFNASLLAVNENISFAAADNITAKLAAIGLLGFDTDENSFFYRRLPFKLSRIMSLHPRMKDAEKLLAENKVSIISDAGGRVDARVEGSGVTHTVLLDENQERCTCTWYSRHQGERGPCKHVLAVKKMVSGS
ncbi:SWIM zinc finger family protein [Chitinophaga rhizophila]|uniref:SWIM zinc finger domain-containing protein n=1 Tax=Chitinophaga rhizophila TaxID=2866212 RepID=A0ABS7GJ71_9BACT|nr:SWIM zinc finger family protein [Chitinophaga rhizophila]MBW8687758.1 SWIM zinc finger domain-containing protein [Chitinophaga rhizophila]